MEKFTKQKKQTSVTQRDIAKLAGVSPAVVSYVINDGPRAVAEETKQRVLKAIEELGYRPNKYAQGLKSKTGQAKRQLGIIMGGGSEILKRPYYGDILSGIYDEAYRQGQRIRFIHFFDELHDPLLFNEHVQPEEISSLIFFPLYSSLKKSENQALLYRILGRIENIVCLEKTVADLPAVLFDRVGAARTAVTHLIRLGHQRIGFVGGKGERITGYRQALLEYGLTYDEELIIHPGFKNSPEEGYEGALRLWELPTPPTAIFAVSDEVAIGVLGALHDRGVRVPDEMALVSIDDLDLAAVVRPALTTVRVPRRQMGVHALRMLSIQEAYPDAPPASTVLRTELIIRQSCGAKKNT
jgi:DNA-binding LacI/PurR family transcriptional regulator